MIKVALGLCIIVETKHHISGDEEDEFERMILIMKNVSTLIDSSFSVESV